MPKLLKILLRFIGIILEWTLIVLIFVAFAIRTSPFQTYLAQKATAYLSDELKTKITIDKVDFIFFDKFALDGILILDQKKDTLAHLGSVFLTLDDYDGKNKKIDLGELTLKNGNVKINRAKENGKFNFQFIADYFKSTDTTESKPYEISLHDINLSKINFKYDDNRKVKSAFGMDYNHIHVQNMDLTSTDFKMLKTGGIATHIQSLSMKENSGLELKSFSSRVAFDDKGLRMNYLKMVTPNSKINIAKLNLNINSPDDFSEFVDKVELDIDLRKSLISLADVAIFSPNLEGMKDKVLIKTKISKRVKDLKIADLDLRIGKKTKIQGTFNLPDFRDLEAAFFDEKITYANIDLNDIEKILLPKSSKTRHIKLDEGVKKLHNVQILDFRLDGMYSNFVVKSDKIKTALGIIEMDNGIMFTENKANESFRFEKSLDSDYDVKIDSFLLGEFISNKDIGSLSGQFFLGGEIFNSGKFDLNLIKGDLKRFDYLDYAYSDIHIEKGSFKNNVFEGEMDIKDDNLNLAYHGTLDFNTKQHFKFEIDISRAILDNLNLTKVDNTRLKSSFSVDISGTNPNNYSGTISLNGLVYSEGDQKFDIPSMDITMKRDPIRDELHITSDLARIEVNGKVDYSTIADDINNQFSKILPAIFKEKVFKKKRAKSKFEYDIEFKNVNDLLAIFAPSLEIATGSKISGQFDGYDQDFTMDLTSSRIKYDSIILTNLDVKQRVSDDLLDAKYTVSRFSLNDSTYVDNATFTAKGSKDEIYTELGWNPNTKNESFFSWKTIVNDVNSYFFNLNPSFFTIREHRWNIVNNSQVLLAPKDIQIQNFRMERSQQYVTIDGRISENKADILKLDIHDLELEDFVSLFNVSMDVKGELNAVATISDPFDEISFTSDAAIRDLLFDNEEIGDINLKGSWGKNTESLDLSGELFYKKNKTFNFDGKYFLEREKENLDFNLDFEYTDIQFANVFMDPAVVSGIRGLIDGELKVHGTPEEPIIEGGINLLGGNAKVEMFGVNFGFGGQIEVEQDAILINNMPVTDEDGNSGSLVGQVYHNNFTDWNMDLFFNLEDDSYAMQNGVYNQRLDRFLVMNTDYKEGDLYYGKAYATGYASIFGYADNLQIDVNMQTNEGTEINFPMYGSSDIEQGKFIVFQSDLEKNKNTQPKIDFTGINMDLNFKITPDARLKIIFDESIEDEIVAYGSGDFAIGINDQMDVEMTGVYTIAENSIYNFVYPPVIKEKFIIKKGGTITWTGDPVNARLNLETYNKVTTTLAEIMPNIESSKAAEAKEVECYLTLTETLLSPLITFDIRVPKANESDRAALNRITSDRDELNKQFFSLLLVNKFQPIQGGVSGGSGAGLQLVSGQLEDMLNSMTQDVRINLDLRNEKQSKEAKVGFEIPLLNDRLVVKTNLGVENSGTTNTSSFVGDVNLEYLINEDGTFRVSLFNESNDNTIMQEKNLGPFTQGAGINYQEEYNNIHDFKMVQYFLDFFRKTKKLKHKKKQRSPVPKVEVGNIVKPKE